MVLKLSKIDAKGCGITRCKAIIATNCAADDAID